MNFGTLLTLAIFATQPAIAFQGTSTRAGADPRPIAKPVLPNSKSLAGVYDVSTVIDVYGRIAGIQVYSPPGSEKEFVDILVRIKHKGLALVELGPKDLVDSGRLDLTIGDLIFAHGSKVFMRGDSSILAQEVRYQGSRVAFRRPDGTPFWN